MRRPHENLKVCRVQTRSLSTTWNSCIMAPRRRCTEISRLILVDPTESKTICCYVESPYSALGSYPRTLVAVNGAMKKSLGTLRKRSACLKISYGWCMQNFESRNYGDHTSDESVSPLPTAAKQSIIYFHRHLCIYLQLCRR